MGLTLYFKISLSSKAAYFEDWGSNSIAPYSIPLLNGLDNIRFRSCEEVYEYRNSANPAYTCRSVIFDLWKFTLRIDMEIHTSYLYSYFKHSWKIYQTLSSLMCDILKYIVGTWSSVFAIYHIGKLSDGLLK